MSSLAAFAIRLRYEDRAATAVEYGMMVALIAAVIAAVVATLAGPINDGFTTAGNGMTPPATP